jgi:hypothetical protein
MSDYLTIVYRRALEKNDPGLLQVSFAIEVLHEYLAHPSCKVIRTDTVGRVRKQGGWSFDFGISPDGKTVHASWRALTTMLPDDERAHWASHTAPAATYSDMYLRMQLSPNSCHDDGDVRDWDAAG